jgi:Cof subfamily protein (haloacid dehalogenase superfamily)
MIRLVALDLDGTLFGDDLIVSPANRAAIAAAQARGVHVTLATGRMFRSARVHAATLNITTPLICYQGALVQDPVSEEVLFHRPVAQALALEVIALLEEWGLYPNVYLNDKLYTSELNPGTAYYSHVNGDLPIHPVGDLSAFLRQEGGDPTKLSTVLGNEERTERTVALLREHFGERLYAVKSHPRFAETVNPRCDKGVALAMLAERLGVAQAETMAIGDGSNDLALLRWAGIGVAMGQAHAEVRAHADYVTGTLAEDGVAAAFERFVLAPAG